jgi:N-acetylneuraminic acid mutarotase
MSAKKSVTRRAWYDQPEGETRRIEMSDPGRDATVGSASSSQQWVPRPPLRQARGGLEVVTIDGKILAIGGFKGDDVFPDVEVRRTMGHGSWSNLHPMKVGRANFAAAVVRGRVYAVGGIDVHSNGRDVVEVFDIAKNHWATSVPLPLPRDSAGAAELHGLLYVAGGSVTLGDDKFETTDSVLVFNPDDGSWRPVAPLRFPRQKLRVVTSGRHLYAIGGQAPTGETVTTVERYDPESGSWTTMNPMHESRALSGVVQTTVGHRRLLVVVGGSEVGVGETTSVARRTTEVFDIESGSWRLLGVLLPTKRGSNECAVEEGGSIVTIGGVTSLDGKPKFLSDVDALHPTPHHWPGGQ